MKIQFYTFISTIALITYFLPIVILLLRRTEVKNPLFLFSMYWCVNGVINLLEKLPWMNHVMLERLTVIYNMLDIPVVLAILWFATEVTRIKKFIRFAAPSLLGVQCVNFMIQGWNYQAATYVLGFSLLTVLVILFWEVYHYMSQLTHTTYQDSMIFMHASLLFAYGSFVIVFIFDYCIKIGSPMDSYLIYYISTIIALMIALVGFTYKKNTNKVAWEVLNS